MTRTRADIARTALEVLTTEGADALSHIRVAEVAGYSKTTVYSHWPSRLDLLTAALGALGQPTLHEPTGERPDTELAALRAAQSTVESELATESWDALHADLIAHLDGLADTPARRCCWVS